MLYLDPANLAVAGTPLADQTGKVAKTYEDELAGWLKERYGFIGTTEEARAPISTRWRRSSSASSCAASISPN